MTISMVLCFVYGCNHNSLWESCKFYRFGIWAVYKPYSRPFTGRKKVKVGFLYSATYTKLEQRDFTISEVAVDWQETMVLQRKCGHPLCALMDIGPAVAASKHTTAPINHTRPSPCKHSPDGTTSTEIADTRLLFTTHLSTSTGWKAELALLAGL